MASSAYALEIVTQIFGALSFASSSIVVLTSAAFPQMIRGKTFQHLITMASLCDALGSFSLMLGYPSNDNPLCAFQGGGIYFFFRASWLWILLLTYELYSMVLSGALAISSLWKAHAVIWSLSLALELSLLSTNDYGQDDELSGLSTCALLFTNSPTKAYNGAIWGASTFYFILIAVMCAMTYFSSRVWWKYSKQRDMFRNYPVIQNAIDVLWMYPVGLLVAWVPLGALKLFHTFNSSQFVRNGSTSTVHVQFDITLMLINVTIAWSGLYGTFLSAIFFYKSKEARHRWSDSFKRFKSRAWCLPQHDAPEGSSNRTSVVLQTTPTAIPSDFDTDDVRQEELERLSVDIRLSEISQNFGESRISSNVPFGELSWGGNLALSLYQLRVSMSQSWRDSLHPDHQDDIPPSTSRNIELSSSISTSFSDSSRMGHKAEALLAAKPGDNRVQTNPVHNVNV